MILVQIILRKIIPRNEGMKLYVTKTRYSKSFQSQRTKSKIKTFLIFRNSFFYETPLVDVFGSQRM